MLFKRLFESIKVKKIFIQLNQEKYNKLTLKRNKEKLGSV